MNTVPLMHPSFVSIYGTSLRIRPFELTVHQAEFEHEQAVLSVTAEEAESSMFQSGVPVTVEYGYGPDAVNTFVGYVDHVQPSSGVDGLNPRTHAMDIVCVGASYPLKDSAFTVFPEQTISSIVRSIAQQFHLRSFVDDDAVVWPAMSQAGKSYWSFLVGLAKRSGFTLFSTNGEVYFQRRVSAVQNKAYIPAFHAVSSHGPGKLLLNWRSYTGANNPAGGQLVVRELFGVDPRTNLPMFNRANPLNGVVGSRSHSPLFTRSISEALSTVQEAQARSTAESLNNQLYLQATAETDGNARTRPGMAVYVQGLSSSEDGLWFVQKIEHRLDRKLYRMVLSLGRDGTAPKLTSSLNTVSSRAPTRLSISQGQWVAA